MYHQVGFTLSEAQQTKLKKGKKNGEAVKLKLSKNQMGGVHDLYLTETQKNRLQKASGAVVITFSKTQMTAQKGGFLGAIMGVARTLLPKLLPVLGTLGLSAASGAISGATHKATGGGVKRAGGKIPLYFSKPEVSKILSAVGKMEGSGVLPPNLTCQGCMNSIKKQEGGFIGTLIASLAGSLLPALLGGKGIRRAGGSKKR